MIDNKLGKLQYVIGDATEPIGTGDKLIIHLVNDKGLWNKGFVLALSKRWEEPRKEYIKWFYFKHQPFKLGEIQEVKINDNLSVVNMVGQHGIYPDKSGVQPVRYEAIAECLEKVAKLAIGKNASVCCPRFGSGLSGGIWGKIEELIIEKLVNKGIDVTVYDLETK